MSYLIHQILETSAQEKVENSMSIDIICNSTMHCTGMNQESNIILKTWFYTKTFSVFISFLTTLQGHYLNMSLDSQNFAHFSYDDASTMSGNVSSIQKGLKNMSSGTNLVHCGNYFLVLANWNLLTDDWSVSTNVPFFWKNHQKKSTVEKPLWWEWGCIGNFVSNSLVH